MCVCVYECKCTRSPAEGVRAPEDGVIGSCQPLTTGSYATTEHTRNCWAVSPAPWTFFSHYLQQLFIRYTCKYFLQAIFLLTMHFEIFRFNEV